MMAIHYFPLCDCKIIDPPGRVVQLQDKEASNVDFDSWTYRTSCISLTVVQVTLLGGDMTPFPESGTATRIRWLLVLLACGAMIVGNLFPINGLVNIVTFCIMIVFAWFHGLKQYGTTNMLVWFATTFAVSTFFEGLSIHTGFPFGNYHYTAEGPRIWEVPLMIPIIYFGLAYTSWNVAKVLLRLHSSEIRGFDKVLLPFIAAVVMSMWDLVTDPQASTIGRSWIWENGGNYFGVPILNFFGWVFVVYVFMQIFTLWITRRKAKFRNVVAGHSDLFMLEPIVVYFGLGLGVLLAGFSNSKDVEIHTSMAMISFFTMLMLAGLATRNLQLITKPRG
jgi:uncharacterized membrane protein